MRKIHTLFVLLVLSSLAQLSARDYIVEDMDSLNSTLLEVKPGDVIRMSEGEWSDFRFIFKANGEEGKPIVLTGVAGKTIITGMTRLVFAGDYLEVRDLHFKNAEAVMDVKEDRDPGEIVSFKNGDGNYAHHSRLTNCYFDHCNPSGETRRYQWVRVYGRFNRVDHCRFEGHAHSGVSLQAVMDEEDAQHRFDHNYFKDRPMGDGNGFECIQFGQSYHSMKSGNSVVEYNYFEKCDGETEIISSKTCNNVYRGNVFDDCIGTMTLRHGNGGLVEDNVFIGKGRKGSGGIRIIGEDHIVRKNYFEGLTGFTGAVVVFYTGIPGSPLNGYFAAHNATFEENVLINNTGNTFYLNGGFGTRGRDIMAKSVTVQNNLLVQTGGIATQFAGYLEDIVVAGNTLNKASDIGLTQMGSNTLKKVQFELNDDGLKVPYVEEEVDGALTRTSFYVPPLLDKSIVGPTWLH